MRPITQRGFTLIELVLVILLLGLVGIGFGKIVASSMSIYVDSKTREALVQQGRFITDRIDKEIRNAVPNSVRVSDDGSCVEWLPIKNSAIYDYDDLSLVTESSDGYSSIIRLLPSELSDGDADTSINAGDRITIMPLEQSELYDASPASSADEPYSVALVKEGVIFTPGASATMVDVSLPLGTSFNNISPARRAFFYDKKAAVGFCWQAGDEELMRYSDYGIRPSVLSTTNASDGVLMSQHISDAVFKMEDATLQRNGLLKVMLTFTQNGESIRFDSNVLIQNTP